MGPRDLKRALPWFAGILAIALAAYVYLRPHGAPGTLVTVPQPSVPVGPSSRTTLGRSLAQTPTRSSEKPTSPARKSPILFSPADGGQGRADPFAPLVTAQESRTTAPFSSPLAGIPLPPPPSFPTPQAIPQNTSPPVPPGAGMVVTAIIEGNSQVAVVEKEGKSYVVGVGDRIGDAVVMGISVGQVVLKQGSNTFALALLPAGTFSLAASGTTPSPPGNPAPCVATPLQVAGSPGQCAVTPPAPPAAPTSTLQAPAGAPGTAQSTPSSGASSQPNPGGQSIIVRPRGTAGTDRAATAVNDRGAEYPTKRGCPVASSNAAASE